MINWNDVLYFMTLAQCQTLSAAADRLGVSQSTVSRRIDSLEESLGVRLFLRQYSGYSLTEAGKMALNHARDISSSVENFILRMKRHDDSLSGIIRLTAPENVMNTLLIDMIIEFRKLHPQICFDLTSSVQQFDLQKNQADIAIRCTNTPPDQLVGYKLMDIPWAIYASPEYLRNKNYHNAEDLMALDWISFDARMAIPAQTFVDKMTNSKAPVLVVNNIDNCRTAIAAGIGVGVLPKRQYNNSNQLQHISDFGDAMSVGLWLLTTAELRANRRVGLFKNFLINKFLDVRAKVESHGDLKIHHLVSDLI